MFVFWMKFMWGNDNVFLAKGYNYVSKDQFKMQIIKESFFDSVMLD